MADTPSAEPESDVPVTPSGAEGVRLVKATEVAEAVERGDAVRRRDDDQPRYGDRPEAPDGPRPSLRFPLADSADPASIARPRVAPVEPRPGGLRASAGDRAPGSEPSLPFGGGVDLPHWTEPATGEVPRVILGDDDADSARWASFADQGPRWRDDQSGEWDLADDDMAHLRPGEGLGAPGLGALDTSERLSDEHYLTFEDLDVPRQELSSAPTRGSAGDPIRIQSEAARPARPTSPGRGSAAAAGRSPRSEPDSGGTDDPPPQGPASGGRDVPTAALVGVAIAALALLLFKIGPRFAMILVFAVVVLSGAEYFTAVRRSGLRPATLLGLAAVAALPLAVYWRGSPAIALILFLLTAFGALWFILGVGPDVTTNLGVTLLGTVYVGVFGSYAALLLRIPGEGVSLMLTAVLAAVFYDVGGFFVGRQFGHRPLSAVSPHKTVEGLVGGMVASVVAVLFVTMALGLGPFSFGQALLFGVVCAMAAPVGDLAESVLKRDLGIKDMGSILPGHGGMLDRFDALLFVLPTAYYVTRAMHLVPGL